MTTRNSSRKAERTLSALLVLALLLSSLLTAQAKGYRARPAVDVPALVGPANNAETTGNPSDPNPGRLLFEPLGIPTFEWEDVGAHRYHLQVATTASFQDTVILDRQNIQYTTYTPTGFDQDWGSPGFGLTDAGGGNYIDQADFWWRVRACDEQSQCSDYSPARQFTRHWGYKPTLTAPDNLTTLDLIPEFKWQSVPGASFYQIQVSTDSGFGSPLINKVTDLPIFTPTGVDFDERLANDADLYWRVRAFHRPNKNSLAGGRAGEWSAVREFELAWSSRIGTADKRPLQLTPPDLANYVYRPLFCWQPVEGAKKYEIDVSKHPDFPSGFEWEVLNNKQTEGTCYAFDRDSTYTLETEKTYYWRVNAIDAQNYPGQATDDGSGSAAFQFTTAPSETVQVPTLFYPPYYYDPVMADTFEDRTVAVPTFMWDHVQGATGYRLRIDDDQAMLDPPVVEVETANASFTFTDTATYPLNDGQVYYWKVRALGTPWEGDILMDDILNKWKVRVDRSRLAVTDTIKLIRPTYQSRTWTDGYKYGRESLTYYPVFAWTAVAPTGSATYQFQIAHDAAFTNLVHDAQTEFTEYTPTGRPAPGSYFWRVRQAPSGAWSDTGRFIVTRNFTLVLSEPTPEIEIDGDPTDWTAAEVPDYADEPGDASGIYDLSRFYIANSSFDWYLGVPLSDTVKLGLYFDINHFDYGGADSPPTGKADPGTPVAHRPEFAIYWSGESSNSEVYEWNGSSWSYAGRLSNIGASGAYSSTTEFLELRIPVTQLDRPGSLSLMMFSLDGSGDIQDRLPNQPGQTTTSAFLTESTTPTPLLPADAPNDPSLATVEHNTPALTWRHNDIPAEKVASSFFFETYEDDALTNLYESENGNSPKGGLFYNTYTHWAPQVHYSDNNTYNWLIKRGGFDAAAPNHFRKAGYLPIDLAFSPQVVSGTITYTNRTPSYSWQPAQSASRYLWELYEGGSRVKFDETMVPYYAPRVAREDGTYTWKVWAIDARNRSVAEAAQGTFSKISDVVSVKPAEYTTDTLVLKWEPVDYAAYYGVEIASDPQFSQDYVTYKSYSTIFTPEQVPNATQDGSFYWRIYTYDNDDNKGPVVNLNIDIYPERIYLPMVVK